MGQGTHLTARGLFRPILRVAALMTRFFPLQAPTAARSLFHCVKSFHEYLDPLALPVQTFYPRHWFGSRKNRLSVPMQLSPSCL